MSNHNNAILLMGQPQVVAAPARKKRDLRKPKVDPVPEFYADATGAAPIQVPAVKDKCPFKRPTRKRKCKSNTQLVSWQRVNCNGSIHYIGLNTCGRLLFSGHTAKELKRTVRMFEAGGETNHKCVCAVFFRDWVVGRRSQFIANEVNNVTRERFVWNEYRIETDKGVSKTVMERPEPEELLAFRIMQRRRRLRGVQFNRPALPQTKASRGDAKNLGIGEDSALKAAQMVVEQLCEWGMWKPYSKSGRKPEQYVEAEKVIRPDEPLLVAHNNHGTVQVNMMVPAVRSAKGKSQEKDRALPGTTTVSLVYFRVQAGTYPHCLVEAGNIGNKVEDTTLRTSDKENWAFRLICDGAEFRGLQAIFKDYAQYQKERGRLNIRTAAQGWLKKLFKPPQESEKEALTVRYDTHKDDGTLDVKINVNFDNLTIHAARTLMKAYVKFRKQVVKPLETYSLECRQGRSTEGAFRYPEPPGTGIGADTPENYDPQDNLD